MVVVGESSGDALASALVTALKSQLAAENKTLEVMGQGGLGLRRLGIRSVGDAESLSATGIVEALALVPSALWRFAQLWAQANREHPHAILLVDAPDFNLPLARLLKRLGVPILYYVSPQVWAWRSGRVRALRCNVTTVLALFRFEEAYLRSAGVCVEWVGHPLSTLRKAAFKSVCKGKSEDAIESTLECNFEGAISGAGALDSLPCVALLPGSRRNEVKRILPALIAAARLLHSRQPGLRFRLVRAPSVPDAWLKPAMLAELPIEIVSGPLDSAMPGVTAAWIASGTATLESALLGVPMVIVYALNPLSFWLGRRLIRTPYIGLPNILAGRKIVPELIQQLSPESLCEAIAPLLSSGSARTDQLSAFELLTQEVGTFDAAARAAKVVAEALEVPEGEEA